MSAASKNVSEAHDKYRTNPVHFYCSLNHAVNPCTCLRGRCDTSQKNLTSNKGQMNTHHFEDRSTISALIWKKGTRGTLH